MLRSLRLRVVRMRGRGMTYEQIMERAQQNYREGIDIVYLEEPEYTNTLNTLNDNIDIYKVVEENKIPEGTFQLLGVEYRRHQTPIEMQEEIKPKPGDHFWALENQELAVYFKRNDGNVYIAGAWECSINEEVLNVVEIIPKPNAHRNKQMSQDY